MREEDIACRRQYPTGAYRLGQPGSREADSSSTLLGNCRCGAGRSSCGACRSVILTRLGCACCASRVRAVPGEPNLQRNAASTSSPDGEAASLAAVSVAAPAGSTQPISRPRRRGSWEMLLSVLASARAHPLLRADSGARFVRSRRWRVAHLRRTDVHRGPTRPGRTPGTREDVFCKEHGTGRPQ